MALQDDLATIAKQEQTLAFDEFLDEHAWKFGVRLRNVCADRLHPVVVDIRRFGNPLFFSALPGSTPDNVAWVQRKANVVARFHKSSYRVGLELECKGDTLADRFGLTLNEFAAHGGAFPLSLRGAGVIGSVAVSGLPQRQDHELVVEVLCDVLHHDYQNLRLA